MRPSIAKLWNNVFSRNIKQSDKMFPNQIFNSFLYLQENIASFEESLFSMIDRHSQLKHHSENFIVSGRHTINELASSSVALNYLCFLVKTKKPKLAFEIGSFVGFSTVNIASVMGEDSKLISIEKFDEFADILSQNLAKFDLTDRVEVKIGDAKDLLVDLDLKGEKVDFAFIDGNKEDYLVYLKWFLKNLSSDGIIVVDDIFFHGDVFNKKCETEKGQGAKDVINFLNNSDNIDYSFLPISNGIVLIKLREN